MLVVHVTDALKDTTANGVAKVLDVGFGMNVAQIDGAVHVRRSISSHSHSHAHREARAGWGSVSGETGVGNSGVDAQVAEGGRCRRAHGEGLVGQGAEGGKSIVHLETGVLVLGNVCAAILAVVDALAGPRRLGRKSSNNLHRKHVSIAEHAVIRTSRHTLVAVEMFKKWTKPMFLSLTILT